MDKVLKKVGLTKCTNNETETKSGTRRPYRTVAKSRRQRGESSESGFVKSRIGVFNIDWSDYVHRPTCRPRALTKKLCRGRRSEDNELYRSNSFKFERFVRTSDKDDNSYSATLQKQISLCDEYSLPLDFVTKKRPSSAAAVTQSTWIPDSPPETSEKKVVLVEAYCQPRDTAVTENSHSFLSYFKPYPPDADDVDSDIPVSDEEQFLDFQSNNFANLNSPDSITESIPFPNAFESPHSKSPEHLDTLGNLDSQSYRETASNLEHYHSNKRNPSPYYYSDLLRTDDHFDNTTGKRSLHGLQQFQGPILLTQEHFKTAQPKKSSEKAEKKVPVPPRATCQRQKHRYRQKTKAESFRCRKSVSLDTPSQSEQTEVLPKRYSVTEDGIFKETILTDDSDAVFGPPVSQLGKNCLCTSLPKRDVVVASAPEWPLNVTDVVHATDCYALDDEMTRQRQIYETAFDCKVAKSDDDLDEFEKVTNHPVLLNFINSRDTNDMGRIVHAQLRTSKSAQDAVNSADNSPVRNITEQLVSVHIEPIRSQEAPNEMIPQQKRGFTPSPPSTAPLPAKFPKEGSLATQKDMNLNSIQSAPDLPNPTKELGSKFARIKDLKLPLKNSLRAKETPVSSDGSIPEFTKAKKKERSISSDLKRKSRKKEKSSILEFKGRPKHKHTNNKDFSSLDSVDSCSGSMESIQSSTSEGNRSTSSSDSRPSTSISSHSSDSGSLGFVAKHLQTSAYATNTQSKKLQILSPISDKSSQEPGSEMSQKCSPIDGGGKNASGGVITPVDNNNSFKSGSKRKNHLANKHLLHLGFNKGDVEMQGSDSGISIQSRDSGGTHSRNSFAKELKLIADSQNLQDLPFDMPKLRYRKQIQDSLESMDINNLPFDMPKLRRNLIKTDSGMSLTSSSQSMPEADRQIDGPRPKLTLNFESNRCPKSKPSLLPLTLTSKNSCYDLFDTDVPLERQGWYHGAISRVEAESILKMLNEGSFLVRNSESTKQDYSLSLKSARGFMHMRIQRCDDTGQYILGQFSKPFDSIPEMIKHFTLNRLPIRGAEHMCLAKPVIAQLL